MVLQLESLELRRSQEEPGEARKSQDEQGGARMSQEEKPGKGYPGLPGGPWLSPGSPWPWVPLASLELLPVQDPVRTPGSGGMVQELPI